MTRKTAFSTRLPACIVLPPLLCSAALVESSAAVPARLEQQSDELARIAGSFRLA